MKYNIEDKVKVIWTNEEDNEVSGVYNGDVGIIVDIEISHSDDNLYIVSFNDDKKRWYCYEPQIELANPPVKRTERGWAGHFICSHNCSFRRNTLIEYGNKKWIVSTVGCMINSQSRDVEAIGYNRWYETMCFDAWERNGYIDANVEIEHYPNMLDVDKLENGLYAETYEELCEKYPTPDNTANDMHEQWVEWAMEEIKKEE